ncbi:hydrolase, haloacid dehalogenase-like family [alpha proteobacterium U9-1i]|nr:hydrolase, haloacid dehalogenase-like family [alpha proteobacterium U9-1i]
MRYRLAIFDFDGTLADSGPWMVRAMNEAAPLFGYRQVSDAEVETLRSKDNRTIIREMGVPMWKLPLIAMHIRRKAAAAPPPPLFAGVREALAAIHAAGVRLAVLSSNSEPTIRAALGAQADLIALYECNAGLFGKAAKFKRLLKRAGVTPGDAIGIGDEVRDIEAAHVAGVTAAAVSWGYATPTLLRAHGADAVFENVAAMAEYLRHGEFRPSNSEDRNSPRSQ